MKIENKYIIKNKIPLIKSASSDIELTTVEPFLQTGCRIFETSERERAGRRKAL